ncbi:MAG: HD domain-containing protein [Candidatus Gastranaerophilales bacterium]|nr:HD domain-containing protein [Candidatus Gastranaerophilales bacterium]
MNNSTNYEVISSTLIPTKAGKLMAKIVLKDQNETFNCVMWQEVIEKIGKSAIKPGNTIKVNSYAFNEQYKSYNLNDIELVEEAQIGLNKNQRDDLFAKILEMINNFKNEDLKKVITEVIFENEELFKVSPAAISVHHNYIGGLMRHIMECAEAAKALMPIIFTTLDKDLVIAGCIVHDAGKMFEYNINVETGEIEKNKEFQKIWINHLHWGFSWANNKNQPELAHIIASHHGTREWNALVEPLTPEAHLVHHVDLVSSRLGAINPNDLKNI